MTKIDSLVSDNKGDQIEPIFATCFVANVCFGQVLENIKSYTYIFIKLQKFKIWRIIVLASCWVILGGYWAIFHKIHIWDRCYDILKLFSPKNLAKILAFFAKTTASFWKKLIITLVFEEHAIFSAENLQKMQKIVIITSTPGRRDSLRLWNRLLSRRTSFHPTLARKNQARPTSSVSSLYCKSLFLHSVVNLL
jgi:hypothetical protein